jgi:hypothetical protein
MARCPTLGLCFENTLLQGFDKIIKLPQVKIFQYIIKNKRHKRQNNTNLDKSIKAINYRTLCQRARPSGYFNYDKPRLWAGKPEVFSGKILRYIIKNKQTTQKTK